MLVFRFL